MRKGRRRANAPKQATVGGEESAGKKTNEPLPTAEWIAEMVMRILGDDLHPERRKAKRAGKSDVFEDLKRRTTEFAVVANVMHIYRLAQGELARRRRVPPPLPHGLTKKELAAGRVTFERGCKLITRETRRDRAEEKYIIWREWEMGQTDDWDGMPEAEEGFSLTHLAEANAGFQKYFKISLASLKRQNAREAGQKGKKAAKPKTKGGQEKSKSGQKLRKT